MFSLAVCLTEPPCHLLATEDWMTYSPVWGCGTKDKESLLPEQSPSARSGGDNISSPLKWIC